MPKNDLTLKNRKIISSKKILEQKEIVRDGFQVAKHKLCTNWTTHTGEIGAEAIRLLNCVVQWDSSERVIVDHLDDDEDLAIACTHTHALFGFTNYSFHRFVYVSRLYKFLLVQCTLVSTHTLAWRYTQCPPVRTAFVLFSIFLSNKFN